jgi:hypothetical protein
MHASLAAMVIPSGQNKGEKELSENQNFFEVFF